MAISPCMPEWLSMYCAREQADKVAAAWLAGLDEEATAEAKSDAATARARLRRLIVDSDVPEVRADAADGWRYTGGILRAADAILGIPPPKSRFRGQAADGSAQGPAASGAGAKNVAREVLRGTGEPGSLGIWWSDFGGASNTEFLRKSGVTRRINMAAECVGKLPEDGIPTVDVPMEDIFDEERAMGAIAKWQKQLADTLEILRGWRKEGQVVNVNCQMGKNRSGACVLIWLCAECDWKIEPAVAHLREITALACANPHLIRAVADFLQVDANVPLNPAGDGGGWVCISPPGSPRAGGTQAFEDIARLAAEKLVRDQEAAPKEKEVSSDSEEEDAGGAAPVFGEHSDVD